VLASVISSVCCFFFFSSRRRHTRLVSDWSSDVCSSDLSHVRPELVHALTFTYGLIYSNYGRDPFTAAFDETALGLPQYMQDTARSEERRVGKECRSRWSPEH